MNKKRWLAVAIAVAIFAISLAVPKFNADSQENKEMLEEISNSYSPFQIPSNKDDGRVEKILEEGDESSRIAVLSLEGTIMAGAPYGEGYTHEDFLKQLEAIEKDDTVKGLLLTVNSPGGGTFESEEIRTRIEKIQEKMPVYVSMQNMAASGGYWISAGADKIFAYNETLTGSIGVIIQAMNLEGLYEKLGIEPINYASGDMKTMGSGAKAPSQEERKIFQEMVDETYGRFVKIVSEGRDMDEAQVRKLADGRVYTANQAVKNGLVDEIATKEMALDQLKKDTGLDQAQVFSYSYPFSLSFPFSFPSFFSSTDLDGETSLETYKDVLKDAQYSAPRPFAIYGGI